MNAAAILAARRFALPPLMSSFRGSLDTSPGVQHRTDTGSRS
jgi:hypothetical protein